MDEQKDPMALWVGTWTPDDAIDTEVRRLGRASTAADERESADHETDAEGGRQ